MIRQLNGMACPAAAGTPLPFHIASPWNRPSCTEAGRPSCRAASRATSHVAARPSAENRLLAATVVASTLGLGVPVEAATPETNVRHTSFGSEKSVRNASRVETTSSPQTRAPSCEYAVHPRCWSNAV
jgi:hypothetical protein